MSVAPLIEVEDVSFGYPGQKTPVLDGVTLRVGSGEHVFLEGASGSGKSTLLGLIGGVMRPSAGSVRVLGETMSALSPPARDALRARAIGVVFQQFNLIPYLSVAANIALSADVSKERARAVQKAGGRAAEIRRLLNALGLDEGLASRPARALSVGQQQRVGVARALIGAPRLILADEPTSALDSDTRDRFMGLLRDQARMTGAGMIFVSHDRSLASGFDRVVAMKDLGRKGRS